MKNAASGNAKRKPMPKAKAEREFTQTAQKRHPKNAQGSPMRGGIRL